jgi:hypothetical protein
MFCVWRKNNPLNIKDSAGKPAKLISFANSIFMKSSARLRGQHINSYSRVIHMVTIANKISPPALLNHAKLAAHFSSAAKSFSRESHKTKSRRIISCQRNAATIERRGK